MNGYTLKPIEFEIDERGCFICTSHTRLSGYAIRFRMIGGVPKHQRLHRFIYEECFGEIPEGLGVLHSCDVKACINPEHLRAGTAADNSRDALERNRYKCKLTAEQVVMLREMDERSALQKGIELGTTPAYVRLIRTGRSRPHQGGPRTVPRKRRTAAEIRAAAEAVR